MSILIKKRDRAQKNQIGCLQFVHPTCNLFLYITKAKSMYGIIYIPCIGYISENSYFYKHIIIIIIINIQPTVNVSCPVGYVMLSSRVELQPLTLVYMGFSGSYLTVNFLRFSTFCQRM